MAGAGGQIARRRDGQIVRPSDNVKTLEALLQKNKEALKAALPAHLTVERISRIALTSIRKSEKLQKSSVESLAQSIIQSAQLGLELDNGLGHAYLVPYWNGRAGCHEAQFQIGYRGMLELAFRSGQIATASAEAVYEADEFEWGLGTDPRIHHRPGPNYGAEDQRELITHFYAVAVKRDGGRQFVVMRKDQVDRVRDNHAGRDREGHIVGPWVTHYVEMGKKTVFRRLFKWLPVSAEIIRAVAYDERQAEGLETGEMDLGGGFDLSHLKEAEIIDGPAEEPTGDGPRPEQPKRGATQKKPPATKKPEPEPEPEMDEEMPEQADLLLNQDEQPPEDRGSMFG